jgi:PAS domain S-box-containing protein
MDKATIVPVRQKVTLDFVHFPGYACYLLHHELDAFAQELLAFYEGCDVPVLRFFQTVDNGQRTALLTGAVREMLTQVGSSQAGQYIDQTVYNWVNNLLPQITREQIHWQDIKLMNYSRRSLLIQYIPKYTEDPELWPRIVEEINRFTMVLDTELFTSYLEMQQQRINSINSALQKREQQLLEAQEIGRIGSFEWDLSGKTSSYTSQVFRIFEMEEASTLDSFLDYVHPDDRGRVRKALDAAFAGGDYECEYRYARNGKAKVIFSRGKVQFADGKPARMIGTIIDVTEHHQIINRLQESEKLHKQAQALTHLGNWSWFIKENKVTWSDEMYRIYGLTPQSEEITLERFLTFVHPDDKEKRLSEIRKALETGRVDEYHMKIVTADGVLKILRGKGDLLTDDNGQATAMLGTCQDVTHEYMLTMQLKEREKYLQQLNQSLRFANQELSRTNEELESFNFIASHDLQEPLRKIQIYSNRILENNITQLPPPLSEYFEKINGASRRMQKLIEDFLAFSQSFRTTQPPEPVDLHKLLGEIIGELNTRIEEKAAIIEASTLPIVTAIPFQIKQLMTNLISNALKYTNAGVAPRIRITSSTVKGKDIPGANAIEENTYLRIAVADNGIGFEEKYSAKIFELFQRLHSRNVYSGTGIGLALCKKIVQHMNGFIMAESNPGKGSIFTFYLPATNESASD